MSRLTQRARLYKDLGGGEGDRPEADRRMFQTEWPVQRPLWWEFMPGVLTEQPEELADGAEHVPTPWGRGSHHRVWSRAVTRSELGFKRPSWLVLSLDCRQRPAEASTVSNEEIRGAVMALGPGWRWRRW